MMPTQEQSKPSKDQERHARHRRKVLISKKVIHALGRPHDLHRLQVRYLWEDHFRVNVLIGDDAASVKVAHSYFLVADNDGNILVSTPQITRLY
jgi:hypothetical protein